MIIILHLRLLRLYLIKDVRLLGSCRLKQIGEMSGAATTWLLKLVFYHARLEVNFVLIWLLTDERVVRLLQNA